LRRGKKNSFLGKKKQA